jgi:protocatechuate 3,4-dioxygenase beta subunit
MLAAPAVNATFADVVKQMVALCPADAKGQAYRRSIVNQYARREVITIQGGAKKNAAPGLARVAHAHIVVKPNGLQDRSACCGTMRLREYSDVDAAFDAEVVELNRGIGGLPAAAGVQAAAAAKGGGGRKRG